MRDPERITRVLEMIRHIWKINPDLRLGQLIGNCAKGSNHEDEFNHLYNMEEDELIKRLEEVYYRMPPC